QVVRHIKSFPLQMGMCFFLYQGDKVARAASTLTHIAFTAHAQLHSFLHACGYFKGYIFFTIYSSFTFTHCTFIGNGSAFTITVGARSYRLHLSQESILHPAHLSVSAAGMACLAAVFIFSFAS